MFIESSPQKNCRDIISRNCCFFRAQREEQERRDYELALRLAAVGLIMISLLVTVNIHTKTSHCAARTCTLSILAPRVFERHAQSH